MDHMQENAGVQRAQRIDAVVQVGHLVQRKRLGQDRSLSGLGRLSCLEKAWVRQSEKRSNIHKEKISEEIAEYR